ncbi:MAG: molybdopterin-binding protein [Planctomycetaceae bacterium]
MRAEILSIGTELTTGAKLDTNCQWLSLELSAVGIPVHFHTTLADDLDANIAAFQIARDRADLVLITGGLGPTLDDLTREALARMQGVELWLDEPSLEIIRGMFRRRGREMPERNAIQAMFPQGAEPIPNPRGTAPGIWFPVARPGRAACLFAALPGVPSEMKPMFRDSILPRLAGLAGGRVLRQFRVQCFGLGESAAEERLGDLTARGRDPEVGITVHEATITLRIVAEAERPELAEAKIAETRRQIEERLGEFVYGIEDEELEDVVARLLHDRQVTVATWEGASAGRLAERLATALEGSPWFLGGVVRSPGAGPEPGAWDDPGHSERSGATEPRPAVRPTGAGDSTRAGQPVGNAGDALARRARTVFAADLGLAVSPRVVALDDERQPVGPTAQVALATATGELVEEISLAGDPAIAAVRIAKTALNLLRRHLMTLS